jgi:hypothetical protein
MGNLRHRCVPEGDCAPDGCYLNTLWDWSPLNDVFGRTGIRVSDVDGIVERNGHFLLLDGKRPDLRGGRYIKNGTLRMYRRFAENGGYVFVFHGQPPVTPEWVRAWRPGGEFVPERPCDLAGLRALVWQWFQWAEQGPLT